MSNAYKGQTQYAQSPMEYGSDPSMMMGGYPTTFGADRAAAPQPSLVPQREPTVNDLFAQYFAQQYYGGQAFDPFAATSLFGGGYGGGMGRGGMGRGGMGMRPRGVRRERRPMPMRGELLA